MAVLFGKSSKKTLEFIFYNLEFDSGSGLSKNHFRELPPRRHRDDEI
jgi:hypothetical protein